MNENRARKFLLALLIILAAICTAKQTPKPVEPYQHKSEPSSQRTVLASRGGSSIVKTLTFVITAYTAGPESTGKHPGDPGYGITASGTKIKEGDCACDKKYPFGTKFYIDNVGIFTCVDRGGDIVGNRIDLYMPVLEEALKFGRHVREVTVTGLWLSTDR